MSFHTVLQGEPTLLHAVESMFGSGLTTKADVDANFVITESENIVEIQSTINRFFSPPLIDQETVSFEVKVRFLRAGMDSEPTGPFGVGKSS